MASSMTTHRSAHAAKGRVTRRESPWKLGGLSVTALGRRVWNEIWDDEVTDRAAALSYYFLFALFPALLFLTASFRLAACRTGS